MVAVDEVLDEGFDAGIDRTRTGLRLLGAKGGDGAGDLVSIFWDELDGVRRSRREGGAVVFHNYSLSRGILRQVTLKDNDLQGKKPRTLRGSRSGVPFRCQ